MIKNLICEYERCRKPFESKGNNRRFCSDSCRQRCGYHRRKRLRALGISTARRKKVYSCVGCSKRIWNRCKHDLCRQCLAARDNQLRDDRVFWAIVEYKTANRGISPKSKEIAPLAGYSLWMVDLSIKRLEKAGRINCLFSTGRVRIQIDIPGGRWVYEGAEKERHGL